METLLLQTRRLPDRLQSCAELWTQATGRSLAALGRAAVNDSSFFRRMGSPQGVTTGTLERFAAFLGQAANWPEGAVPEEVAAFAHVTGVTANMEQNSTGQSNGLSGECHAPAPLGAASTGQRSLPSAPMPGGGTHSQPEVM